MRHDGSVDLRVDRDEARFRVTQHPQRLRALPADVLARRQVRGLDVREQLGTLVCVLGSAVFAALRIRSAPPPKERRD